MNIVLVYPLRQLSQPLPIYLSELKSRFDPLLLHKLRIWLFQRGNDYAAFL